MTKIVLCIGVLFVALLFAAGDSDGHNEDDENCGDKSADQQSHFPHLPPHLVSKLLGILAEVV